MHCQTKKQIRRGPLVFVFLFLAPVKQNCATQKASPGTLWPSGLLPVGATPKFILTLPLRFKF